MFKRQKQSNKEGTSVSKAYYASYQFLVVVFNTNNYTLQILQLIVLYLLSAVSYAGALPARRLDPFPFTCVTSKNPLSENSDFRDNFLENLAVGGWLRSFFGLDGIVGMTTSLNLFVCFLHRCKKLLAVT